MVTCLHSLQYGTLSWITSHVSYIMWHGMAWHDMTLYSHMRIYMYTHVHNVNLWCVDTSVPTSVSMHIYASKHTDVWMYVSVYTPTCISIILSRFLLYVPCLCLKNVVNTVGARIEGTVSVRVPCHVYYCPYQGCVIARNTIAALSILMQCSDTWRRMYKHKQIL